MVKDPKAEQTKGAKILSGIIFIVILLIPILWIRSCMNVPSEPHVYTKMDALRFSENFIEERLKSPTTAKFISTFDIAIDERVKQLDDSTFLVNSWVDSQNGFGAMIRTKYSCKMTFLLKNETYRCEDIVME